MTMKIILCVSSCWIPLLILSMLMNETKFKKNIVVGVTLPYEARENPDVIKILSSFKKWVTIISVGLTISSLGIFLIPNERWVMTIWSAWIVLIVFLPYLPYIITNIQLKKCKQNNGWGNTKQVREISINTAAISSDHWISPVIFLPSVLICLCLIYFDPTMYPLYLLFAGICIFSWISYRYMYRNKAEMVDENTDITVALSNIRKYNWGKVWIICSYGMSVYAVVMCFFAEAQLLNIIVILGITVFLCVYSIAIEFKTRALQEKLTKDSGHEWYVDEDDHWIYGLFYYNPDDSRVMINQRIGVNSTVNLAKPLGKFFYALMVIILAGLPVFSYFMDSMGTATIKMEIVEDNFKVQSGWNRYEIKLDDIKEVGLQKELPTHLSRRMGTGMDTYLEGNFKADGIGDLKVLLDPTVSPYILIQTNEGDYYLFGSRDSSFTKDTYNALRMQ